MFHGPFRWMHRKGDKSAGKGKTPFLVGLAFNFWSGLLSCFIRTLIVPCYIKEYLGFRKAVRRSLREKAFPPAWQIKYRSPVREGVFVEMRDRFIACHMKDSALEYMLRFQLILNLPLLYVGFLSNPLDFRLEELIIACWDAKKYGMRKLAQKYMKKIAHIYRILEKKKLGGREYTAFWGARLKQIEEARACLEAESNTPAATSPELAYVFGKAKQLQRKWQEAADYFTRCIKASSEDTLVSSALQQRACSLVRAVNWEKEHEREPDESLVNTRDEMMRAYQAQAGEIMAGDDESRKKDLSLQLAETYYLASDYEHLIPAARDAVDRHDPGSREWAQLMFWLGMALELQNESDHEGAAGVFDRILAADIEDNTDEWHIPTLAAFWRGSIAQGQGDRKEVDVMIDLLKTMPDSSTRNRALDRFDGRPLP